MKSFISVKSESHFPIQNIPFGIFKSGNMPHACSAIGDFVVDLTVLEENGFFEFITGRNMRLFDSGTLNKFISLEKRICSDVRSEIQNLLNESNPKLRDNQELRKKVFFDIGNVEMCLPVEIGDYTDFYSSKEHATNVGIMFRGKENALMPNWVHMPVAYHGRASSVVISGTDIVRPKGQTKADDAELPVFGPSNLLDFELETGFIIGRGNELGNSIPVNEAEQHIFGMVLVNDWSARDIQKWEYVPLGPFLGKNFATSISPWIVTLEALGPFKTKDISQVPEPLDYLKNKNGFSYDINLEVGLRTGKLKDAYLISRSNFKYLYWDICQQLAHHTVNGCNVRTGDLLASGTISGSSKDSFGSMLELTWRGSDPIKLPNGEERKFLLDEDEVIISGWCQGDGFRIGFGEVTGRIIPSK